MINHPVTINLRGTSFATGYSISRRVSIPFFSSKNVECRVESVLLARLEPAHLCWPFCDIDYYQMPWVRTEGWLTKTARGFDFISESLVLGAKKNVWCPPANTLLLHAEGVAPRNWCWWDQYHTPTLCLLAGVTWGAAASLTYRISIAR